MITIYRSDFLSQEKRNLGFVGAVVCEFDDPDDVVMIAKLQAAHDGNKPACIKGQYFTIGDIDISEFFGSILFGLKPFNRDELIE